MYLQKKEEIKRHIGNKHLLKRLPRIESVLDYVSGIQELTLQKISGELIAMFFIEQYPKGILISDRRGKHRIGLSYSELKTIEIIKQENDLYTLNFKHLNSKNITFSFQKKDRLRVLPFVKSLPYKEESDPRNETIAREEILRLKDQFASDYFTDRTFCQELKSVVKKNMILDINENHIKYGDRVVDVSSTLGYTINIEEVRYHGISRFEYKASIHHPEEHLFISFTSASFFLKEGEYSQVLNQIGLVLFDVISRPIVARWFDKFANGESIDYKDFSLTRQGILLKTQEPNILIHWDEIVAQSSELFRWPYSNMVFQKIDDSYDHRGNMLLFLTKWLQSNPKRLLALMGREYHIS